VLTLQGGIVRDSLQWRCLYAGNAGVRRIPCYSVRRSK